MLKQLRLFGVAAAVLVVHIASAAAGRAAVTMAVGFQGSVAPPNSFSGITQWSTPPTVDTTALAASPGAYCTVPESNVGSDDFDPLTDFDVSFAQSFTATTSGKLTKVQFPFTGSIDPDVTFRMNVYDGLALDFTDISFFDDPNVEGTADPFIPGTHVSNNLLTDTSTFTLTGYTVMGTTAAVLDFSLTGADQVDIVSGKTYIVEFVLGEAPFNSNFLIGRNGVMGDNSTNYTGGQAFRAREPLNGNALRDIAMAFTISPPASTLAADFNGVDGVTAADLAIWRTNFGLQTGATKTQGNTNPGVGPGLDGDVDGDDFLIWQRQLGLTSAVGAATPAPEPSGALLALVGMAAFASIRRRFA